MKVTVWVAAVLFWLPGILMPFSPGRFVKVSEHFYFFQSPGSGANTGAVVTEGGVLLIDTQPEREVAAMLQALKRVTSRPVRWVLNTHDHDDHTGGNAYFLAQNVTVISARGLRRPGSSPDREPEAQPETQPSPGPHFNFGRQIRLFPGGLEVRVLAVEHRAHTARDVVVFVPGEKVLQVGDLFVAGSYPEIDTSEGEGSALGWLDAVRRVIEAVPLLKSAMPQPRPDPSKPYRDERTLEEQVIVISGHGPATNLAALKSLLEISQKLRAETARAVAAGRNRDSFLASPALASYRIYKNFEAYATQLYDALKKQ